MNALVDAIIEIPREVKRRSSSYYALLRATGYFEKHQEVTIDEIANLLRQRPDLIDDWKRQSDDQRSTETWFLQADHQPYVVGYYPDPGNVNKLEFNDQALACATYVKKQIELMRVND